MSNEAVIQRAVQGVDEAERPRAPEVKHYDCESLWMDERSRQKLLESFGQLTIADLLDGSI